MLSRARGRRCQPGSAAPLARVRRCGLGTMLSRARGGAANPAVRRRWRGSDGSDSARCCRERGGGAADPAVRRRWRGSDGADLARCRRVRGRGAERLGRVAPLARVGRFGLGTMPPRARGGRGGLGARRPSTSRRRPPKLGPRRLARGRPSTRRPRWSLPITRGPVTSPVPGDVAASGGADAASLPVPPLPRAREVDVTNRISRRPFAREVDAAQPQLSPPRAIEGLSNNLRGRTLAFSRGRGILHANAGKIR